MLPLTRYGATVGRKRDWRVCFLLRAPEGEVTMGKEGWVGWSVLAKNWEHSSDRWAWIGRICVSA